MIMRQKEKLEKYEELSKEQGSKISTAAFVATEGIIIIMIGTNMYNSFDFIYPTIFGSVLVGTSIWGIATTIAEKAGLESRINEIKEKLELYKSQNNQSVGENSDGINYEEEKGRSL